MGDVKSFASVICPLVSTAAVCFRTLVLFNFAFTSTNCVSASVPAINKAYCVSASVC